MVRTQSNTMAFPCILILVLLSLTLVLSQTQFNCRYQIGTHKYMRITLRGQPKGTFNYNGGDFDYIKGMRSIEKLAQDRGLPVRLVAGPPLTDSKCLPHKDARGTQLLLCGKSVKGVTYSNIPNFAQSSTCPQSGNSSPTISTNFNLDSLKKAENYVKIVDAILEYANYAYAVCTPAPLNCLPDLRDAECGDGVVQYAEQCEKRGQLTSEGYLNQPSWPADRNPDFYEMCDDNCSRRSVMPTLRWVNALNIEQRAGQWSYNDACISDACGRHFLRVSEVISLSSGLFPTAYDSTVPFPAYGLPHPVVNSKQDWTGDLYCFEKKGCGTIVGKWMCRLELNKDLSSSKSPTWVPCDASFPQPGELQFTTVRFSDEPDVSNPTAVGALGSHQLYPLTDWENDLRFPCGPVFYRRKVECMNEGVIVDDSRCLGASPEPVRFAFNKPCVTLRWVQIGATGTTSAPDVSTLRPEMFRVRKGFGPISAEDKPIISFQTTSSCASPTTIPPAFSPCFRGCGVGLNFHHRVFRCLESTRLEYLSSSSVVTQWTFVTEKAKIDRFCYNSEYHHTYASESEGPNCRYGWLCESGPCEQYNPCKCDNVDDPSLTPQCFSIPQITSWPVLSFNRPVLLSPEACTPDNVVGFPQTGAALNYACLHKKQGELGCYQPMLRYTKPSNQDDAPPSSPGYLPLSDPFWDQSQARTVFCTKQDGRGDRLLQPPFSVACVNQANPSETVGTIDDRCNQDQLKIADVCKRGANEWRCTLEPVTTPDSQSFIETMDLRPTQDPTSLACNGYVDPNVIFRSGAEDLCGEVNWQIKTRRCFAPDPFLGMVPVDDSECESRTFASATTTHWIGCQRRCFDQAKIFDASGNLVVSNTDLGPCNESNPPPSNKIRCGNDGDSRECSFSKMIVADRCVARRGVDRKWTEILSRWCSIPPHNAPLKEPVSLCFYLTPSVQIKSPASRADLELLERETRGSAQCKFRPICRYHSTSTSPTDPFPLVDLTPTNPIKASSWTTNACHIDMDCEQRGVCARVNRVTHCGVFANNKLISHGGEAPRTNVFTPAETLPDFKAFQIKGNDNETNFDSESNFTNFQSFQNDEHFDHFESNFETFDSNDLFQSELDEIDPSLSNYYSSHLSASAPMKFITRSELDQRARDFAQEQQQQQQQQQQSRLQLSPQQVYDSDFIKSMEFLLSQASTSGTCGKTTSNTSCRGSQQNCQTLRCYLPKTLEGNADGVPHEDYTEEQCTTAGINRHCTVGLQENQCRVVEVKMYYLCYQDGFLVNSANCGIENRPVPEGWVSRTCTVVRGCNHASEMCFWKAANDGNNDAVISPVPSTPDNPKAIFPCSSIDAVYVNNVKDTAKESEVCDGLNFCGKGITASVCVFSLGTDEGSLQHVLQPEQCRQYSDMVNAAADPNRLETDLAFSFTDYSLPSHSLTCSNFNQCSAWACSVPSTLEGLPSLEAAASYNDQSIVSNLNARNFYSQTSGIITQTNCQLPLVLPPESSNGCGISSAHRRVGCLQIKTSKAFAFPTFHWNPKAARCGSSSTPSLRSSPPISDHVNYSPNCKPALECAPGGVAFGTKWCSNLHCPLIFDPVNPNPSAFAYNHNMVCRGPHPANASPAQRAAPGPILPLLDCAAASNDLYPTNAAGQLVNPVSQCSPLSKFCQNNLQMPMGFGPNANVTNTLGKFIPEDNIRLPNGPLSLSLKIDPNCSQAALFTSAILVSEQGIPLAQLAQTLQRGGKFFVTLNYSFFSNSLAMAVYLVPLSQEGLTGPLPAPYLIADLPASVNPLYGITVPMWVPNGKYFVVVYGNSMMIQWLKDVSITITGPQPTLTPTNPKPPVIVTDGVVGDCAGYLCLHGKCLLPPGATSNGIDPKLPGSNYQCQCSSSNWTGKYCAQSATCVDNPAEIVCDKNFGVISPTLQNTAFDMSKPVPACDLCNCLGDYTSASGCTTCGIDCGEGVAVNNCAKCECPTGRQGPQCECSAGIFFTIFYRLPPPFIRTMFARNTNQFVPITIHEEAQLVSWKRAVVRDVATDLVIPSTAFTVASWGSTDTTFGVVLSYSACAPFPALSDTVPSRADSIRLHAEELQRLTSQFKLAIATLKTHAAQSGPLTNYPNAHNLLAHYKPSFNTEQLLLRFNSNFVPSGNYVENNEKGGDENGNQNGQNLENVNLETLENGAFEDEFSSEGDPTSSSPSSSSSSSSTSTTSTFAPLGSILPQITDKTLFFHSQVVSSPSADASGGFQSISTTFESMATAPHPGLEPIQPRPFTPQPKPFDTNIILYILLPVLFALLFGAAVLLCCSWKYQILCFKGYKERKAKERRAKTKSKRAGKSNAPTSTQAGSTAPISTTNIPDHSSETPTQTQTQPQTQTQQQSLKPITGPITMDVGQRGDFDKTTADYHPDDFENDDEEADFFAEGTEVEMLNPGTLPGAGSKIKRQSIAIGGMKRVSVVGLPKGWSALNLAGKQIFVNTETMQSTTVMPRPDGTIPEEAEDKGW